MTFSLRFASHTRRAFVAAAAMATASLKLTPLLRSMVAVSVVLVT